MEHRYPPDDEVGGPFPFESGRKRPSVDISEYLLPMRQDYIQVLAMLSGLGAIQKRADIREEDVIFSIQLMMHVMRERIRMIDEELLGLTDPKRLRHL